MTIFPSLKAGLAKYACGHGMHALLVIMMVECPPCTSKGPPSSQQKHQHHALVDMTRHACCTASKKVRNYNVCIPVLLCKVLLDIINQHQRCFRMALLLI